jgi:hypothetical protein
LVFGVYSDVYAATTGSGDVTEILQKRARKEDRYAQFYFTIRRNKG